MGKTVLWSNDMSLVKWTQWTTSVGWNVDEINWHVFGEVMSSGSIYIWLLFWIQGVDGEYKGVHSPISRTFSRPPTPFQSMDCGIWPLSIWLCTIPNRFVHLGPWSLGPFRFSLQNAIWFDRDRHRNLHPAPVPQPHPGAQWRWHVDHFGHAMRERGGDLEGLLYHITMLWKHSLFEQCLPDVADR